MAFSPLSLRTIAFLLSLVLVLEFSSSIVQATDVVEAGYDGVSFYMKLINLW
ncbi:hypothetical protein Scep_019034 [Stephania cephalantha]|uniref:Uncharacterized protein n=1 Tax=Stephania cephalantha TaxID=152367 RepID=A0AAP0IA68_9MAGN